MLTFRLINSKVTQVKMRQNNGHRLSSAQSKVYTGTEHREWLLFSIRVNPSLMHNNTCFEVMQTATFMSKTYFNILDYLKITRLFTLSCVFSFGGEKYPSELSHFSP